MKIKIYISIICISLFRLVFSPLSANNNIENLIAKYHETDSIAYIDSLLNSGKLHLSDDYKNLAHAYRIKGESEVEIGSDVMAHKHLYQAVDLYAQDGSDLSIEWISSCYNSIIIGYQRHLDTLGMNKITHKMKVLCENNQHIKSLNYYYNLFLSASYYTTHKYKMTNALADSTVKYGYEAMRYLDDISPEIQKTINLNPTTIYYNMSTAYYFQFEPKKIDSVEHYLDIMESKIRLIDDEKLKLKSQIMLVDATAWVYFHKKDYNKALETMDSVVRLIDQVEAKYGTPMPYQKNEIYIFYVKIYKALGDYKNALKHQNKLEASKFRLYGLEKNNALNELRIKHDVEQKESHIKLLNHQLINQRNKIHFTASLVAILMLVIILLIILISLRKKNVEHKLYEAALEKDYQRETQNISEQILLEKIKSDYPRYADAFSTITLDKFNDILSCAISPLTTMEKRYVICFLAGMKPTDIAEMFTVESRTIYTVKYRMKKKFPPEKFPF